MFEVEPTGWFSINGVRVVDSLKPYLNHARQAVSLAKRRILRARLPRLYFPGCAQYVIQRGNNREVCFYSEADYKAYPSSG